MKNLNHYFSIGEAISLIFYPHVEVIVHDLASGKIAAIYNNFSNRKVGDESLLECEEFPDVFPIYLKTNYDGRKIKSISVTLKSPEGKAIGLLCINVDLSKFDEINRFVESWLTSSVQAQPTLLFKDDWREKINTYVSDYLAKNNITIKFLDKEKKKLLVFALRTEGAFKAKNAANYVADVLGLSRATIYNYLKENNNE